MCNHRNTDNSLLKSHTHLKSCFKPSKNIFWSLGALFIMVSHSTISTYFSSRRLPEWSTIVARRRCENKSKCWNISKSEKPRPIFRVLIYAIQSIIYSLALGFAPCFPLFLDAREAKTLLTTLGTMVVTKSCVSSGGGCVVVGLKASQDKDTIKALIEQPQRLTRRAPKFQKCLDAHRAF